MLATFFKTLAKELKQIAQFFQVAINFPPGFPQPNTIYFVFIPITAFNISNAFNISS